MTSKFRDYDLIRREAGGQGVSREGVVVYFGIKTSIKVSAGRQTLSDNYAFRSYEEGDTLLLPKEFLE